MFIQLLLALLMQAGNVALVLLTIDAQLSLDALAVRSEVDQRINYANCDANNGSDVNDVYL